MSKDEDEKDGEYPLYDGTLPHSDEDTSLAAAEAAKALATKKRARVRAFLESCGSRGATDDEIEVGLGFPHQTASARRRELVLLGLARDSGLRRQTRNRRWAKAWVLGPWPMPFDGGNVPPTQGHVVSSMPTAVELRHAVMAMRVMYKAAMRTRTPIPNLSELVHVCQWLQQLEGAAP
jgi:hypothetical protein